MPRFIKNGPIIPDSLVQELEEDRVVTFCGAGISAGAGLPDFRGLVEYCYNELGAVAPAAKDPEWGWLDRMLGALEGDFPDHMRAKVVERLDISATDLTLHEAILKLARLRGPVNGHRLVTTNFDLFFEQAQKGMALGVDYHSGPVLPIPRNDRIASWRSIVYLHGRLNPSSLDNQHLVLTSADFGRAYLTDAWAARFVARLFSEFTVLFIGYSLNDPVLRYMTDAFAADDELSRSGRKRAPAYIFVPYKGAPPTPKPWRQRRLEPIFYRAAYKHRALKNTLIEWARARQDYLASVRTIVQRYGTRLPSALEPSYASNLVWAVCDRDGDVGHGAKIFAGLPGPAPIEWLGEFERRDSEVRATHAAEVELAKKEGREPAIEPSYHIEMLFPPVADGDRETKLSGPAFELQNWLCQHLENDQLVNWVIQKLSANRRAHPRLRGFIRQRLDQSPSIASGFAIFWRIVASEGGWASAPAPEYAFSGVQHNLAAKLGAAWFDQELIAALRPYLTLSPSYRVAMGGTVDPNRFATIADAEVKLKRYHAFLVVDAIDELPNADTFWAERLDAITGLLKQVFDLYATVDKASASGDPSAMSRPSISPHAQNRNYAEWARLYDLIWRGWSEIDATNSQASRYWIQRWRRLPYLGFRRLALAATTQSRHFTPAEKLEALLHV
ncbi:SIR2 family protein [Seohaeicola saemankumensis]|uniref:SIR2 family protein n=1 Tax=Seohaeicola saemankumensis TaxID=481181 RepID=UPI0035CF8CEC